MKKHRIALAVAVLLIIIFGSWLFFGQVRKSTVVVITRFGRPARTLDQPGLFLRLPPPIELAYTFDQRIQNFEDKLDEDLTSDHYSLLVMVYVGWQINDAQAFFPKFAEGSIPAAESAMEGLVRTAKKQVVGQHPLSDFVSTDSKQLKFEAIENEILAIIQKQVNDKGYGITMKYLGIKKLELPESVTQEVFKRMTSDRQRLVSEIQSKGEAEASKIKSAADSKSAAIIADANAEATRIKGEAQKESLKSFAIFQQNPQFATFLLNLNAMEASLKDRATLIFDNHTQPYNLFQGYTNGNNTVAQGYTNNLAQGDTNNPANKRVE
jgi:membrane protease subunit HflC